MLNRSLVLEQACQTQARGPNLAHSVIIFGLRDNYKCLLDLARQYIAHAQLILRIPECFASVLARQSRLASTFC